MTMHSDFFFYNLNLPTNFAHYKWVARFAHQNNSSINSDPPALSFYQILNIFCANILIYLVYIFKSFPFRRYSSRHLSIVSPDRISSLASDPYFFPSILDGSDLIIRPCTRPVSLFLLFKFLYCHPRIYPIAHIFLCARFYLLFKKSFYNSLSIVSGFSFHPYYFAFAKFDVFSLYFKRFRRYKDIYYYCGYNITSLALNYSKLPSQNTTEIQHGLFVPECGSYHASSLSLADNIISYGFFANSFLCFTDKFKLFLSQSNSLLKHSHIITSGFPVLSSLVKPDPSNKCLLLIPYDHHNHLDVLEKYISILRSKFSIELRFHPSVWSNIDIKYLSHYFSLPLNFDDWANCLQTFPIVVGHYSQALVEAEAHGLETYLFYGSDPTSRFMINPRPVDYLLYPELKTTQL